MRPRDTGLAALLVALALVGILYAPVIGYDLTGYDDAWLVRDNWLLRGAGGDWAHAVFFDFDSVTRYTLGAEYLPVRDLSIVLDDRIWGDWYGGYHLTSLLAYLGAIAAWFAALSAFGIERRLVGIAALVWAVHPSHAETVTWLAERKGVLAALFAGLAALGYARWRVAGGGRRWLVLAVVAAVAAVWSKAPAAFALAALAGLEVVLPARRASWRRSVVGLGVIGGVALAAFVPVVVVANATGVVGTGDDAPAGHLAMAIGLHGFYLRLSAMTVANAVSYPIALEGPSAIDLGLGGLGLLAAVAAVVVRGRWRPPPEVRAAGVLWLAGWFPISRLVLPLQNVLVADRYLLFPTLGVALAIAAGLVRVANPRIRWLLVGAVVAAASARTLDARSNWSDGLAVWQRAVASSPHDGDAWSMYVDAIAKTGDDERAFAALEQGLATARTPKLLLRRALLLVAHGTPDDAYAAMREAAEAGEARAASNVALMLLERGQAGEALRWAERASGAMPMVASAHRTHGKVALAAGKAEVALAEFDRAFALEPSVANRFNLGLALGALGRFAEARAALEACLPDPRIGPRARAELARLAAVAAPPSRGMNVVVILVDTVRADRLGVAGYRRDGASLTPRLDAFAATATRFTHAYAQASNTPRSLPSIFASKYPSQIAFHKTFHNFPAVLDDNELMFEALAKAGVFTMGFSSHFYFEPRRNIGQGVAEWNNDGAKDVAGSNADVAAPRIVPRAIAALEQRAKDGRRFGMFVHLFEPHSTYVEHSEYPVKERGVAGLMAKYDYEIAFVDRWVGELIDAVDRTVGKDTVVVVLSDHGEMFGGHVFAGEPLFFHGHSLHEEILRVPLLVRVPGKQARVVDDVVGLVDVAPTVLAAMGVGAPKGFVGRSLLPLIEGGRLEERAVFAEIQRTPDFDHAWRVMVTGDGTEKIHVVDGAVEVYDLAADPGETKKVTDPVRVKRLRDALDAVLH